MEVAHPGVLFQARLEVVIAASNLSFTSTFDHRSIAKQVIDDRL